MAKDLTTGLIIRDGTAEWTGARRARSGPVVGDSGRVSPGVEGAGAGSAAALSESDRVVLASRLRSKSRRFEGRISVGLPSGQMLIRVIELPTADPVELKGMVGLQTDKLSPFPAESAVTSFELLERTGTSSRVAVAVVKRSAVESFGALLTASRIFPARIDLEMLGWFRLMADAGHIVKAGAQVLFLMDTGSCDVIATQNGMPVLFRSLGAPGELTEAEICAELDHTLTTLEAEHGITVVESLAVWHWDEEPRDLVEMVRSRLSIAVAANSFKGLPPLSEGLARRALDSGPSMNLALPEWDAARGRLRLKKRLVAATVALVLGWLAGLSALFGGIYYQKLALASLEARLVELEQPAEEAKELRRLLAVAESYANRTQSALECLREVTTVKPLDMEFKSFKYEGDRDKRVTLQGESARANSVLDFENALDKSRLFEVARLDGPRQGSQGQYAFTITLALVEGE